MVDWENVLVKSTVTVDERQPAGRRSGAPLKTAPALGVCLAGWVTEGAPRRLALSPFRSPRFAGRTPWVDEHADSDDRALSISR